MDFLKLVFKNPLVFFLDARRVVYTLIFYHTSRACYYPHLNGGFWRHNKLETPSFEDTASAIIRILKNRFWRSRSPAFMKSIRVASAYVGDNAGTSGIIDKALHSLSLNTKRFLTTILRKYP